MMLLDCHIENFGAFHNFDLSFTDGLNVVMQPNGWGKTTLAAFVKAMFYGFDGKRVRDVSENERLRYKPWQGGKYGGYLDFEAGGREYRVTRSFGATRSRDGYKVVDLRTGTSVVDEVGEDLGEWLFGIDASAFQKSVYIVQNGLTSNGSTTSLRNRLNSLVNEADDVAGYEAALKSLDERRKFYKKTGDRGRIADISTHMTDLVSKGAQATREIASLKDMQRSIGELDSQIEDADSRILEAEKTAEEEQGKRQEREALIKVRDQLREQAAAAKASYEAVGASIGGAELGREEIDGALSAADAIDRAKAELQGAREELAVANEKQVSILRGQEALPSKDELDERRRQANELASKLASVKGADTFVDEGFLAIRRAIEAKPSLAVRANDAVAGYAVAAEVLGRATDARVELVGVRVAWAERKTRIRKLAEELEAASSCVDDRDDPEMLRRDAAELRKLAARLSVDEERAVLAQAELERCRATLEGDAAFDWETLAEELEEGCLRVKAAVRASDEARERLESAEREAAELLAKWNDAKRDAEEKPSVAQQAPKPSQAPGYVCVALGIVLAVAGVAMGGALALVASGAAVLILGVVLLVKGRPAHDSAPSAVSADGAAVRAAQTLKQQYDAGQIRSEAAKAEHEEALAGLSAAEDELRQRALLAFPDASLEDDLVAECGILAQTARSRFAAARKASDLEEEAESARARVGESRDLIVGIVANYECLPSDAEQAAATLDERAGAATASRKNAAAASSTLADEVRREVGDGTDPRKFVEEIDRYVPFRERELLGIIDEASRAAATYREDLNASLVAFGLEGVGDSDLAIGRERLSAALEDFSRKAAQMDHELSVKASQTREIESLRQELEDWSRGYGVTGADQLTEQWFKDMADAVSKYEKAAWECAGAKERVGKAQDSLKSCVQKAASFMVLCGARVPDDPSQVAALTRDLVNIASTVLDRKKDLVAAEARLGEWMNKNAAALAEVQQNAATGAAASLLGALRSRRDDLMSRRAQVVEQRSASLEGLEGFLAAKQQTELLSKERQKASSALFTVQTTARYLEEARKGLDGRYLGDLGCRFEDYAAAWLVDDEVDAEVTSEFGVSLYDGKASHDVAGYSTGYRDLLDMCLRMALVDTIYQAEAPMLIMDDPFSALDEQKLRRAFRLLDTLAAKFQIVYFTCHPSRVENAQTSATASDGGTPFVLPEQRERRELPRARAKREAEERARAQAELVASFKVVPVTQGRSSIRPDAASRTVASNLFQVGFELNAETGMRDNSFEAFFIDEKGRVLCDRQNIQVLDGQVVPDRVRFDLTSRDDSGSTYELIVHEDGRSLEELAARIPFKVQIAFANDLFDL